MSRIKNTFYNIDYYQFEPLRKLPEDEKIKCKLSGSITQEILKRLNEIQGFLLVQDSSFCEEGEGILTFSMECYVPKRSLEELKKTAKELALAVTHNSQQIVLHEIPGGYLYSGWKTGRKTKLKPEDLPKSFVYIRNYKKHGYIQTAGVVDVKYKPSPFHNHAFKDDFLYISYHQPMAVIGGEEKGWMDTFKHCDEYIFGSDIIGVLDGIEKNNPDNEELQVLCKEIEGRMVEQYNAFIDEASEMRGGFERIESFDELRKGY